MGVVSWGCGGRNKASCCLDWCFALFALIEDRLGQPPQPSQPQSLLGSPSRLTIVWVVVVLVLVLAVVVVVVVAEVVVVICMTMMVT